MDDLARAVDAAREGVREFGRQIEAVLAQVSLPEPEHYGLDPHTLEILRCR